ncbi:MAG: tRNA (guanosine(37)-N1)-methyltransferase TrmD [Armatimonadota bacterium]|nr:tRNA (guanosine(37)-N1)-methyltransferase TrmD [Armatimonadota bacterium]MDR7569619.1 tRNA (guanosine(37)-N1)-methyltransferase TrmD [Armatimonadota bacterium]MDR7614673.1 tRNA (guanosine(37)-N1)-methyltransferase TrmD [Armatimonadota bacterium]
MRVDIVTIFPEIFLPLRVGVLGRAQERGRVRIEVWNLRDFASDRHRTVDDYPYGGGPGMVMKPEPFFAAVEAIERAAGGRGRVLLTSPQGRRFDQRMAQELSREPHLVILCGRYEGVDERVVVGLPAEEVSIGDYVLTGGELAAMVIVDATARLVPGVVGDEGSVREESFMTGILDHPHYTRPAEFRGMRVPEVLLKGNHAAIARWRRKEALRRTLLRRPDLLRTAELGPEDRALLREIEEELGIRV